MVIIHLPSEVKFVIFKDWVLFSKILGEDEDDVVDGGEVPFFSKRGA